MIDIFLLNPVYVTIFWALVLLLHGKRADRPTLFLGCFMVVAALVYISHYLYFTQQFDTYYYFDSVYILAYLLVYPLYHIYVRLLTVDSHINLKKHLRFIVAPVVVFILTLVGYAIMGKERGVEYIVNIMVQGESPSTSIQKFMVILFLLGRLTFLFQTVFYLILSFKLIRKNNLKIENYYSNVENRGLRWLQLLNISFGLASLSSAILVVLGRNLFLHNSILLIFPSIIFSILLFFIGFMGSNQRAVFTEIENTPDLQDEGKSPQKLKAKLEQLFEKEMIYKNQDLKIWDISFMLGVNSTHITDLIKTEYNRNFRTHVNHYRFEHAKALIYSNPNLSNQQIAELAGFGTVKSFFRAFQASEKISLIQFRRRVNDE
ncbi:MAG: helix-turn-helix domain-containing protein [Bacteroidales bacterium]